MAMGEMCRRSEGWERAAWQAILAGPVLGDWAGGERARLEAAPSRSAATAPGVCVDATPDGLCVWTPDTGSCHWQEAEDGWLAGDGAARRGLPPDEALRRLVTGT
jgi:hypothetical protein